MKILDLGCRNRKYKSENNLVIGIDNVKIEGVDIIYYLNKFPYPFKSNEFEIVYTSHTLKNLDNLDKVFNELIRILKNNGKIIIRCPYFSCDVSYRDPTHKRLFSYSTFDYFTDECFYTKSRFKIINRKLKFTRLRFIFLNIFINPIIKVSLLIYERFFCWVLSCAEVLAELKVEKLMALSKVSLEN